MDLVASSTAMSTPASSQQIDENAVRRANLVPSDAVAVDVGHDRQDESNKPPFLKHVYATDQLVAIISMEY